MKKFIKQPLSLNKIREYWVAHSNQHLVDDVDVFQEYQEMKLYDSMWKIASSAPHRFADLFDQRFLVILDEFQNITQYVYRDEKCEGQTRMKL
jgi:hypothetical protein